VRREACAGIDRQDLWALGARLYYRVAITWSETGESGCYDVVFSRAAEPLDCGLKNRIIPFRKKFDLRRPWQSYANNPLNRIFANKLVSSLRAFLKERLPDYMVPASYVLLDSLPLTVNGKVDRKALPEPEFNRAGREGQYLAAGTAVEEMIAEIWGDVLKQPRVGVRDNFFELGGHSLLAMQVMSRLRQAMKVEVALRKLFEEPTVEALAREVERQWKTERQLRQGEVKKLRRGGPMEVSVVQR